MLFGTVESDRNIDKMNNTQGKANRKVTTLEVMSGGDPTGDALCDKRRVKGDMTAVFTHLYVCHQEIFKFICVAPAGQSQQPQQQFRGRLILIQK